MLSSSSAAISCVLTRQEQDCGSVSKQGAGEQQRALWRHCLLQMTLLVLQLLFLLKSNELSIAYSSFNVTPTTTKTTRDKTTAESPPQRLFEMLFPSAIYHIELTNFDANQRKFCFRKLFSSDSSKCKSVNIYENTPTA